MTDTELDDALGWAEIASSFDPIAVRLLAYAARRRIAALVERVRELEAERVVR